MSEAQEQATEIKAPARKKPKKRKAAKRAKPVATVATGEFAGITAKDCPSGCTAGRCVISTVGVCAHPYKSATNGFGPVTLGNRDKARKLIKHQVVDLKG